MSATRVKPVAIQDQLQDVMSCCICGEIYKNPKILPCVHTFCLTCLQRTGTQSKKSPGDTMPCPICRQGFKVPQKGFTALPKNFFMASLIEITRNRNGAGSLCDKHELENQCLYCSECNEVLCLVCLRESHQNHRLLDLDSAANNFRSQFHGDISTAQRCKSDALKTKENLAQKKSAIVEKIEGIETEVCQVRQDLKALIDQHADSLLQCLSSLKKKGINEIEIEENEIDKHMSCLESFEKCWTELTLKDQHDGIICTIASKMKHQIVELELLSKSIVECPLSSLEINFMKTVPVSYTESANVVGEVKANFNYSLIPELVATIRTHIAAENGDGIRGKPVCKTNKVLTVNKNPVVGIYDSSDLNCRPTTKWHVQRFVSEVDLRYCVSTNGIIYIVNGISRETLRIDQNLLLINFLTQNDWGRLSVSNESTIVATCYNKNALREYSLQGTLLREIELCSGMIHPLHAVKLGNGEFVVSHGDFKDDLNRVCIVNDFGNILKSFGELRGCSIKQLDIPICLAVDEDGNILVLDKNNSRVLLLSPALEFKRELITKTHGLQKPVAMHLDQKTSRLYIGDNKSEKSQCVEVKVLVFGIK